MKWIVFFSCIAILLGAKSQTIEPFKVGDSVSGLRLRNMVNHSTPILSLEDYKGKLVILDFWSTGCRACIEAWPKLLSLQDEFRDQIQIILVNPWEDQSAVNKSFERRKKVANIAMTLPSACGKDSVVLQQFAVSGVPHVVWIDKNGKIISITFGGSLNAANIKAVLKNESVKMPQKIGNDDYIKPDFTKPLFVNGNGGEAESVLWQSILTHYPSRLWAAQSMTADEQNGYNALCAGCSVEDLYRLAYSNRYSRNGWLLMLKQNRIVLEVSDTTKYKAFFDGEIQYQNLYVYNLMAPPSSLKMIQERMQYDLNWYFKLDVKWEKRKKQCLVWKLEKADTSQILFKGGVEQAWSNETGFHLNGRTIADMIESLEESSKYYWSPYPIINETGFRGKVGGVEFSAKVEDHRALDKAFRKFGMRFTLEERLIDVLVIREKNEGL